MISQKLPPLLFLFLVLNIYEVQAAVYQEIYSIPSTYQTCPLSSPCRMWNGASLPACPSGILSSTDLCKQSLSTCPGIWPELTYNSDRYPTCKNSKTGCWELLNKYSGIWECIDPRIIACPQSEVGMSLKLVNDNWVCEDAFCPGNFALQKAYDKDPFYKCVKHETDSQCPGDGEYKKGNLFYVCESKSCQLIKKGDSYYCPADPETCQDTAKAHRNGGEFNSYWYCQNPIKEFNLEDYKPFIIILIVGFLALLMYILQRLRGRAVQKALLNSETHANASFNQYQAAI